jgi:prephenate dehydrogenase
MDLFEKHLKDARKLIEDENYDELQNWMKKANTLHEIL